MSISWEEFLEHLTEPDAIQRWVEVLEAILYDNRQKSITDWIEREQLTLDANFIAAFIKLTEQYIYQTSIASTHYLRNLSIIATYLLYSSKEAPRYLFLMLTSLLQTLAEKGIGPDFPALPPAHQVRNLSNYRGAMLAERGEYSASIVHFSATLRLDTDILPAYCNRARVQLELHRFAEALQDCDEMVRRNLVYSVGITVRQLIRALLQMQQRRPGTIAEIAQERGVLGILRFYDRPLRPNENPAILTELTNFLTMPREPGADGTVEEYNHLGVIHARLGNDEEALRSFEQAAGKGYARAFFNCAQLSWLTGDDERALEHLSKHIQLVPQDAEVERSHSMITAYRQRQAYLAEVWKVVFQQEVPQEERPSFEQIDAEDDAAWEAIRYANRLIREQQHAEALLMLERIPDASIQGQALLPAERKLLQARIIERQEQPETAIAYYQEALQMFTGTRKKARLLYCLEKMAGCMRKAQKNEEALEFVRQAWAQEEATLSLRLQERLCLMIAQLEEELHLFDNAYTHYERARDLAFQCEHWGSALVALTSLARLSALARQEEQLSLLEQQCLHIQRTFGDLAYAGPNALPRPQIIAQAQQALALESVDPVSQEEARDLLKRATELRKQGKYEESLPLYRLALASYLPSQQWDSILRCLNGLGIAYQQLADRLFLQEKAAYAASIRDERDESDEDVTLPNLVEILRQRRQGTLRMPAPTEEMPVTSLPGLQMYASVRFFYRILRRDHLWEMTEKARLCHRWALEICKELDDLLGQIQQIGNLAIIEQNLGNQDTGYTYHRWAIRMYLQEDYPNREHAIEDAAIDLVNLAYIEEQLGDRNAGSVKRRMAANLGFRTSRDERPLS